MSLSLLTGNVTGVLLADGWHGVAEESFDLDSYEFLDHDGHHGDNGWREAMVIHGGGQSGICATGFRFQEKGPSDDGGPVGGWISGPLSAVLAVCTGDQPR